MKPAVSWVAAAIMALTIVVQTCCVFYLERTIATLHTEVSLLMSQAQSPECNP